ncbi:MAG: winged helix-turn-helix domain-containing protein [Lentimicrobiaceae bacterium]|nr:winged helix-turn-helix domain-containing protein [Lentimicrobiaceae bacterium]
MNTCEIGRKAGRIWEYLYTNGECSATELKKKLKINTKELYLALGWISRNDKIAIYEKDGEQYIFLLFI